NPQKSIIVWLHDDNQPASYVNDIPEVAYALIEYTETPLTIVSCKAKNLARNGIAAGGRVGIRSVRHPFCKHLLQRFRNPIVSTSANISGDVSPAYFDEISEQVKAGMDYIVEYGRQGNRNNKSSTVMKLDPSGKFEFLRK